MFLTPSTEGSGQSLVRVPYRSAALSFSTYNTANVPSPLDLDPQTFQEHAQFLKPMVFSGGSEKILASQMEIKEYRDSRGEIPARVCLLGSDKATYNVYALPKDWEEAWGIPPGAERGGDVVMKER
jgi:anaphase-promoting complex subunit 4